MSVQGPVSGEAASRLIDEHVRALEGWRGETLARMRALILETDPEIVEEVKWMGVPVWSRHGIICTGESYKKVVKLTFAQGASLPDPARLFNSSLEGNTRRAIDLPEGAAVDARAFQALVRAAIAFNALRKGKAAAPAAAKKKAPAAAKKKAPAAAKKKAPAAAKKKAPAAAKKKKTSA